MLELEMQKKIIYKYPTYFRKISKLANLYTFPLTLIDDLCVKITLVYGSKINLHPFTKSNLSFSRPTRF